jgi:hypothetical protein
LLFEFNWRQPGNGFVYAVSVSFYASSQLKHELLVLQGAVGAAPATQHSLQSIAGPFG